MPELPEVESARRLIAQTALHRRIVEVDDSDQFVCRPHAPGDIRTALVGRTLTAARRIGKSMWCETSPRPGEEAPGPDLGIHLGMGGIILVTEADGRKHRGGDYQPRSQPTQPVWNRFTLEFADGGNLVLFDKRRLGRVRLDPMLAGLGPDAAEIRPAEFRSRIARGTAPVKARLLDQSVLAGVGNLLADQTLWQAKISPERRVDTLDRPELDRLHRALRSALASALDNGGVHTGRVIDHRTDGGTCPRCGAPMTRGTVGGRTTWWCSAEQRPSLTQPP